MKTAVVTCAAKANAVLRATLSLVPAAEDELALVVRELTSVVAAVGERQMIVSVVGTRPNYMKTVPVIAELARRTDAFDSVLVHTGQHYDDAMSKVFLDELGVGEPDHLLGVGSGTHGQQTARVMERLEPLLVDLRPDIVLVPGDVNSTLAAALVAAKLQIRTGHIEAGLRSFDRTMPEEINRVLTDSLADYLFIHSPEALENLVAEGCARERVHYVGNTMIDTLVTMRERVRALDAAAGHGLAPGEYLVVTLHRPSLVDGDLLSETIGLLAQVAEELPVVFPVHPRTRARMRDLGLAPEQSRLHLLDPLGYLDFMSLVFDAAAVLTDSGGIQEETTYLDIPCFTLRNNTERPVTVELGTNTLLGLRPRRILEIPDLLAHDRKRRRSMPPFWDGRAAKRIVDVLADTNRERAAAGRSHSRVASRSPPRGSKALSQ